MTSPTPDEAPSSRASRLQLQTHRSYMAIAYDGVEVGFCTPEFSSQIVEVFNREERLYEENDILRKALQRACLDLINKAGGDPKQVSVLIRQYMDSVKRPEHGTRAIAYLLRDRQTQLDMGDREFVRFCDSYRLSPEELRDIFNGKDISDTQIKNISRILGRTIQELTEIRDGFSDTEISRLARILGVSAQELDELFAE